MGCKPWTPKPAQREMVGQLAGLGFTHEQIAAVIGITNDTLTKHCGDELRDGKAKTHGAVAGKIYEMAMKGDRTMLIFIAKTQMRWKETQGIEHSGPDGLPLTTRIELVGVLPDDDGQDQDT